MAKVLLSERERKILTLAGEGLIDKEIAQHLEIQLATVRTYWERLRVKLGASNRTHAIALALPYLLDVEREDRRHIEEINRFIIRAVEDIAIFTCDGKGIVTSWNIGVERVLGYHEDEWVGQMPNIIFAPEDALNNDAEKELIEASARGISVNDRWHVRRDGSRFWGRNTVIPFRPAFAEPGFAKIVQDRSEVFHLRTMITELEGREPLIDPNPEKTPR